jgi:hypothetical protein
MGDFEDDSAGLSSAFGRGEDASPFLDFGLPPPPKEVSKPISRERFVENLARYQDEDAALDRVVRSMTEKKPMEKTFWRDWLNWRKEDGEGE